MKTSGLNWPLLCKGKIQEGTRSREVRGWQERAEPILLLQAQIQEGTRLREVHGRQEYTHEKRGFWAKEFVSGMWVKIAFLLPLFFLLGPPLPSVLDSESSNLLPPEAESIFLLRLSSMRTRRRG